MIKNIINDKFFKNSPFIMNVWDSTPKLVASSNLAIAMFGLSTPEEFVEEFPQLSPALQPCGTPSEELAVKYVKEAFKNGFSRFDWMHQTIRGEALPTNITLVQFTHKEEKFVAAYITDLRDLTNAKDLTTAIVSEAPFAVDIWSEDFKLIFTNKKTLEMHGITRADEYVENFFDFSPPTQPGGGDSQVLSKQYMRQAIADGYAKFDWEFWTIDKTPVYAEMTLVRFTLDDKPIVVAYTVDVTTAKLAVQKMKEAAYHHQMYESSPVPSSLWTTDVKPLGCNQAMANLLKLENKEDFPHKFFELNPIIQPCGTLSKEKVENMAAETLKHGSYACEWTFYSTMGDKVAGEAICTRIDFPDVQYISVHFQDLTLLNNAIAQEKNRKNLAGALNKAAEILLTVDSDTDSMLIALSNSMQLVGCKLNVDRVQIWRNESIGGQLHFVMRYEWLSEYGKGMHQIPLGYSHPYSNMQSMVRHFTQGRHMNGPITTFPQPERDFWLRHGTVSVACLPLFVKGKFFGFLSLDDCQDEYNFTPDEMEMLSSAGLMFGAFFNRHLQVREMEETNKLLKAAQEKARVAEVAEESNRAKSKFLARMSHEIRTPISAVMGIAEVHMREVNIPPVLEEAFSQIYTSSLTLLNIVNDILDLSKIEAGKMLVLDRDYDIASIINDVSHTCLAYIDDKSIDFTIDVDPTLPTMLRGDGVKLGQILTNVLSNAFKYTTHGEISFGVTMGDTYDPEVKDIVATIADTGSGMTTTQINAIYKEYTRFHEIEGSGAMGTGLGMSIVRQFIEIMDGKIVIDSEVGKGTTVKISIPQKVASDAMLGEKAVDKLASLESSYTSIQKRFDFTPEPMPYGKVLVVDDIDMNIHVAQGLLNFYNLQIETCQSGVEAVEKVKAGQVYDIIFMDQMMPMMNGTEAMHEIRNLGYTGTIVVLTANALLGQAEILHREGFDGYLSKPIQTNLLHNILVRHIKDKQTPETIAQANAGVSINHTKVMIPQDDEAFVEKLRQDFLRNYKNIYSDMIIALEQEDSKTAHRLAHSLKGLAGLIKERKLVNLAANVENLLNAGSHPTYEVLTALGDEFNRVIANITPAVVTVAPVQAPVAVDIDMKALFDKLTPLLKYRSTESLDYLEQLKAVPDSRILQAQIENIEFAAAEMTLKTLRQILDV